MVRDLIYFALAELAIFAGGQAMTGFFPDWSPYIWSAVAALTLVVMLMIWGHEIWSKIRARTRLQQADSKLGDHPPLIDGIDSDGDGDLIPMIDGIDMARVALNAELQDNPIVLSSHSGGENIFESVVFEMLGTDESDNVPVYAVKPPMKTPEVIRDIYLKYTIRSDGTATHNMDPRDTLTNLQVCRRDVERWIKNYCNCPGTAAMVMRCGDARTEFRGSP